MRKYIRLFEKWITFIKVILDPWVILLTIFLLLIIRHIIHGQSADLPVFTIFLIVIASALIGSVFMRKWIDLNDEKQLISRGELAIKNLKMIYFNLLRIEKRVKANLTKINENNPDHELIKSHFEEIIEKTLMIEEECINAISSWSDIIDEADAKTILINIFELKEEKSSLKKKIHQLQKEFFENPEGGHLKNGAYEKQLDQLEFELKEISAKIEEKESRVNKTILSGMSGTALYREVNSTFTSFNKSQEN